VNSFSYLVLFLVLRNLDIVEHFQCSHGFPKWAQKQKQKDESAFIMAFQREETEDRQSKNVVGIIKSCGTFLVFWQGEKLLGEKRRILVLTMSPRTKNGQKVKKKHKTVS
jgi:hypothetical protein